MKNDITLVTGLWDIKRSELSKDWSRSYDHYLEKFKQLLLVENNMIIFGESDLQDFVFEHRDRSNTQFIVRSQEWFKNEFFEKIQKIRTDENWLSQTGWLRESTQAKLEMYNPLVMSKVFLLNDANIMDQFNSEYLFWIDAGLTNTVHPGYFTHDKVLQKLPKYVDKFTFVCFPYETTTEIHGFDSGEINKVAGEKVDIVARGGFFGGPKSVISDINGIYYNILSNTLNRGFMGTEESIFSIMVYKHSDIINYYEIEGNGLMGKFFEDLKDETLVKKSKRTSKVTESNLNIDNTALYVITFNSPNQFETLIKSMEMYDRNFLDKPKKFLLDNSSDLTTTERYKELCDKFGFEHIKKDNLGICGGRQWIAEHFQENEFDFYWFFEDDMFFYGGDDKTCKNGFVRKIPDLYNKSIQIVKKEYLDFLKLNFTEFYGDNGIQFAWYNLPGHIREEYWPEKPTLPVQGLDPNAPRTKFTEVRSYKGLAYGIGEVYYCNWPQVVSRYGNEKMFLITKWARPFEQTYMSYIYQETKKGHIKPALLFATPTEHDRFEFYLPELRKES